MDENKELTLADHLQSMLNSDGWKFAKEKFDQKVMDLQNIHNLDYSDISTLSVQLAARKMAVEYMTQWYLKDIVGFIEQQKVAQETLQDNQEDFIGRE